MRDKMHRVILVICLVVGCCAAAGDEYAALFGNSDDDFLSNLHELFGSPNGGSKADEKIGKGTKTGVERHVTSDVGRFKVLDHTGENYGTNAGKTASSSANIIAPKPAFSTSRENYKPEETTRTFESLKPTPLYEPPMTTQNQKPAKPTQSYEPVKPAQSYEPAQPTQSYEPAQPIQSYEPEQPTQGYVPPTQSKEPEIPTQGYQPVHPGHVNNLMPTVKPVVNYKSPEAAVGYKPVKPVHMPITSPSKPVFDASHLVTSSNSKTANALNPQEDVSKLVSLNDLFGANKDLPPVQYPKVKVNTKKPVPVIPAPPYVKRKEKGPHAPIPKPIVKPTVHGLKSSGKPVSSKLYAVGAKTKSIIPVHGKNYFPKPYSGYFPAADEYSFSAGYKQTYSKMPNVPPKPTSGCPYGWLPYDGHCYYFSRDKTSWFTASMKCRYMGGYLAVVDNPTENSYFKLIAKKAGLTKDAWFGLNDILFNKIFIWEGGNKQCQWWDWKKGQPNQTAPGYHHCAALGHACDFQWIVSNCHERNYYICEFVPGKPCQCDY